MKESIISALRAMSSKDGSLEILTDCCTGRQHIEYEAKRKVFNRRFQFRPTAIVLCKVTEHVQEVVKLAAKMKFEIRVRSGGHDYEGESSGTDTVVIDLSRMTSVAVEKKSGRNIARVQPGNIFKDLIPQLTKKGVCIPHGTCGTVGIAGFTMGGGWGPWTRKQGMCCESLIGATMVLGDGRRIDIAEGDELLWALRGGGGMSYGIVTEFIFDAFDMPANTIKFQVDWDASPGFKVLKLWEGLIAPGKTKELIGTNLKIIAIRRPDGVDIKDAVHPCTFYGYYEGTEAELKADMLKWFADLPPTKIIIPDDKTDETQMKAFETWDRLSSTQLFDRISSLGQSAMDFDSLSSEAPFELEAIPPDLDIPEPFKITSKVAANHWDDEGRVDLLRSLESDLIYTIGREGAIRCYVTLGAISGPYYAKYKDPGFPRGSAFPYKKRPFTIQYQAWWDNPSTDESAQATDRFIYNHENRAQDWIEECRSANFPQTLGSFISFKDDAVPTRNYFMENYEALKDIKKKHSADPDNMFRTRKTII